MLTDELRAAREALVLHHMKVEEAGDAEAVVATFARPHYDLVALGQVLEGPAAVAQRVHDIAKNLPGCKIEVVSLRHCEDAVIMETRTRGFHTARLFDIEPTGRPYDSRGICIFLFEGADLVSEIVYYDRLTLMDQIRGGHEGQPGVQLNA